jgi:hypothetical protein
LVKHPNCRRLIASTGCKKATKLLPALVLRGDALGNFEILRPSLRGNGSRKVGELLRLQTKELIASLTGLQRARSALA